jgi:hypothetical protein
MKQVDSKVSGQHRRLISTGFVIAGMASVFGLAAMVCRAVAAVTHGHGMETYRTLWLVEDSWIGFLVFVGVTVAAMFLAALFRLRDDLQWRRSERVSRDQRQSTDPL